ncbi:hypothetical protein Ndes2526B_g05778 [Nannochloris sp. 'desiccata']|nr:hypothetical protein NADE_005692 [Chlorella desiccata (nom. nud.)]
MNNTLNWKVLSRAQSASNVSSTYTRSSSATPLTSTPVESAEPLLDVELSPEYNGWYAVTRYQRSPAPSSRYAVPPRPESCQLGTACRQTSSTKRYWELGGLGPTSVATPEWQVLKERWMAKQAFGKAATAANRLARLRRLGKMHQEEAERVIEEPEVNALDVESTSEDDGLLAVLEERASNRDIALALNL